MAHKIDKDLCVACGTCAETCPISCISEAEEGGNYVIDGGACIDCGSCAGVCPAGAISPEE